MDALKRRLTGIVVLVPLVAAIDYALSYWGGDYGFTFFPRNVEGGIQKCARSWSLQFW